MNLLSIGLLFDYMRKKYLYVHFSYVIRIGTNGNNETTITRTGSDFAEEAFPSVGILNCEEYRDFWVSWTSREVKIGRGTSVDSDVVGT